MKYKYLSNLFKFFTNIKEFSIFKNHVCTKRIERTIQREDVKKKDWEIF